MVATISAAAPALDIIIHPAGPEFTGVRPAVLVLPGGGFRVHAEHEHESEGYARWLSGIGVHAFVLCYRLLPHRFPAPLQDARAGLAHVRRGEHGLAVDLGRVGVIGSSAGGHLDLLPDEAVAALLGDLLPLTGALSPARHLDGGACPTFMWATAEDPPGLPNALAWAQALADGVRYGDHGAARIPHTAQWAAASEVWLRREEGSL